MTTPPTPSPEALILDMLRDVLARQAQQMGLAPTSIVSAPEPPALLAETPAEPVPEPDPPPARQAASPMEAQPAPLSRAEHEALERFAERAAEPPTASRVPAVLRYLMAGLLVLLVVINLPLLGGTALARALPDRRALIIRDGLVLKGPGPEIYVIEAGQKRWISSLEAFSHNGYSWDVVHVVEQDFLDQFPAGRPLHVLVKCASRPHVYRLENDERRWIKDIPTLLGEGHVWGDVRVVDCDWLRMLPEGPPIPPDAGPPPEL